MKSFTTLRGFLSGQEPDGIEPASLHHATLRIFSETGLDFDEITSTLGLVPTMRARKGDRVGPRSPENKGDVWMFRPSIPEQNELAQHVDALWKALKPHTEYLRALKQSASVEVFLGYSSNVDHGGITIPFTSLEMFTTLEMAFALNVVVQLDDDK